MDHPYQRMEGDVGSSGINSHRASPKGWAGDLDFSAYSGIVCTSVYNRELENSSSLGLRVSMSLTLLSSTGAEGTGEVAHVVKAHAGQA